MATILLSGTIPGEKIWVDLRLSLPTVAPGPKIPEALRFDRFALHTLLIPRPASLQCGWP